ncbi:hypothetical protein BDV19DRAFT_317466 [Aspergillus venezuelensis]
MEDIRLSQADNKAPIRVADQLISCAVFAARVIFFRRPIAVPPTLRSMSDNSFGEESTATPGTDLSHLPGRVCSQCRKQKQRVRTDVWLFQSEKLTNRQCDRQHPCRNCVHRSIPSLCTPTKRAEKRRRQNGTSHPASTSAPRLTDSQIGNRWPSRGTPSYHGNSYFGHQAAAIMMQVPTLDLPVGLSTRQAPGTDATRSFRNERGPYGHVWELMGYLPRQKSVVDMLTERFLSELNGVFDGVHEESFGAHYADFWDKWRAFDDLRNVNLRWLSLLFIILAFSELLDCPQACSIETQQDRQESSLHFYWAARKCVVIAPTFSGESADIVRAGILITRYLSYLGRIPESWLTGSFAGRMAQAQGMHVDGECWGLPRKVLETRRRLWSTLHYLDRTVALTVGRPYTVNDKHCGKMKITNVWLDDLSPDEVDAVEPRLLNDPTPATYHLYQQQLASLLGTILDVLYPSLKRRTGSASSVFIIIAMRRGVIGAMAFDC